MGKTILVSLHINQNGVCFLQRIILVHKKRGGGGKVKELKGAEQCVCGIFYSAKLQSVSLKTSEKYGNVRDTKRKRQKKKSPPSVGRGSKPALSALFDINAPSPTPIKLFEYILLFLLFLLNLFIFF